MKFRGGFADEGRLVSGDRRRSAAAPASTSTEKRGGLSARELGLDAIMDGFGALGVLQDLGINGRFLKKNPSDFVGLVSRVPGDQRIMGGQLWGQIGGARLSGLNLGADGVGQCLEFASGRDCGDLGDGWDGCEREGNRQNNEEKGRSHGAGGRGGRWEQASRMRSVHTTDQSR